MKKILLVDDVQLLLEIQKRFLAYSHIQVLTANDGVEALETARRERPDLVIMDKYMPRMDGLTCCATMKEDPMLAHIPIIMATNATQPGDTEEYLRAGCVDVLSKPIDCKLFLNAIRKHIPAIERRSIRVPRKIEMQMSCDGKVSTVATENLSLNGLFAITDREVVVGSEVKFTFLLPEKEVPMEIRTRVVWQNKGGNAAGFGVEFVEVTGQGIPMLRISELKAFIEAYNKSGPASC